MENLKIKIVKIVGDAVLVLISLNILDEILYDCSMKYDCQACGNGISWDTTLDPWIIAK